MSNTNIGLNTPPNADPAYRNSWASGIINPNMTLLDNYTAGQLSKDVSGSANVILTYVIGSGGEAVHSHFNFTGVLTGNITVFYPENVELNFSAQNNSTGAFTLTLAADNGSHAPAGTTIAVANGGAISMYRSDGVNVASRASSSVNFPIAINQGGTGATDAATAVSDLGAVSSSAAQTVTGAKIFSGSQALQVDAGDGTGNPHPLAFVNITGATQYSGRISFGSAAPGTLQVGEIYFQTS